MEGKLSQRWLSRRKCRGHRVGWWRDAQGGVGKLADQKGSMHYPKAAEDRNATDCLFFLKVTAQAYLTSSKLLEDEILAQCSLPRI